MSPKRNADAAEATDGRALDPESGTRPSTAPSPERPCRMDAEAEALLARSPEIVPLLAEACEQLQRLFGDAVFDLERVDDPEAPAGEPMLFLVIRSPLEPGDIDAALRQLDEGWWIDNLLGKAYFDGGSMREPRLRAQGLAEHALPRMPLWQAGATPCSLQRERGALGAFRGCSARWLRIAFTTAIGLAIARGAACPASAGKPRAFAAGGGARPGPLHPPAQLTMMQTGMAPGGVISRRSS